MPVDLTKLDEQSRARHLGNPEGEIGLAIAGNLNTMNARVHQEAYRALAPAAGNAILEIGFGNGHLVPELMALAGDLHYDGIDISETMVAEANRFNAALAAQGRYTAQLARSSAMPFKDASFDRALALNTIYFWDDPKADLSEIRRVMRSGGWLVLGAMDPASTTNVPVFRHGFRFYDQDQLKALLKSAGFSSSHIDVFREVRHQPNGTTFENNYFIVTAHA
jgi:ubiquinone/menaquinone biosynthesis C-methylase UbiE